MMAALLLVSFGLGAQPQGPWNGPQNGPGISQNPHHKMPKIISPEEVAKKQADEMKAVLNLSDKQYKKVFKMVKTDQEYRQRQREEGFGAGMPPQGMPGGQGGFGGPGMGGPGGGMGGPGMGGPGGGMGQGGFGGPGMGGPGGGMSGQNGNRPEGGPEMRPGENSVSDEYLEKQDKKLQKILTPEQYGKWRSKHPAEHRELPPLELRLEPES